MCVVHPLRSYIWIIAVNVFVSIYIRNHQVKFVVRCHRSHDIECFHAINTKLVRGQYFSLLHLLFYYSESRHIIFQRGVCEDSKLVGAQINKRRHNQPSFVPNNVPWKYWQMLCICCCIIQIMYWQQRANGSTPPHI